MGLDNGFVVRSQHRKITRDMLPTNLKYPYDKNYGEDIEIIYWRKNWGLRNAVLDLLGSRINNDDEYEYLIETPSQVFDVMQVILSFMDKEKWEMEGQSIWEYDEILPTLKRDIINLAIMAAFMQENPDVFLVFYDSY